MGRREKDKYIDYRPSLLQMQWVELLITFSVVITCSIVGGCTPFLLVFSRIRIPMSLCYALPGGSMLLQFSFYRITKELSVRSLRQKEAAPVALPIIWFMFAAYKFGLLLITAGLFTVCVFSPYISLATGGIIVTWGPVAYRKYLHSPSAENNRASIVSSIKEQVELRGGNATAFLLGILEYITGHKTPYISGDEVIFPSLGKSEDAQAATSESDSSDNVCSPMEEGNEDATTDS